MNEGSSFQNVEDTISIPIYSSMVCNYAPSVGPAEKGEHSSCKTSGSGPALGSPREMKWNGHRDKG